MRVYRKTILLSFCLALLWGQTLYAEDYFAAGQKYMEQKDYKKAVSRLKKATKQDPNNIVAWRLLGDCYTELENYKKALKAYDEALTLNPDDTETKMHIGFLYGKSDDPTMAINAFKEIVAKNPDNVEAQYYLGVSYAQAESIHAAFKQYEILKTVDQKLAQQLYDIIFLAQ